VTAGAADGSREKGDPSGFPEAQFRKAAAGRRPARRGKRVDGHPTLASSSFPFHLSARISFVT
jgi:hypothetical protein